MGTPTYEKKYESSPTQIAHREERNRARAELTKRAGHKLTGDVAHIVPLAGKGSGYTKNVRVESVAKNRGWRRGRKGYSVGVDK